MGRVLCVVLCALFYVLPGRGLRLSTTVDTEENHSALHRDVDISTGPDRHLVVFLWIINNPDAIAKGAGDPRHSVLVDIGNLLKKRGHTVLIDGDGFQMNPNTPHLSSFEWLGEESVKRHGKPDVMVTWVNYLNDHGWRETGNNPLIKTLMTEKEYAIPQIIYESGMLHNTVTADPRGQLADSYYVDSLNDRVQRDFDDKACTEFIHDLLAHDASKRPQASIDDIPSDISGRFIFIPTQKFNDVSVTKYSNVTYPELLNKVTDFCKAQDLPLVIKIHPHLEASEEAEQKHLIDTLKARHPKVYLSVDSINDLLQKAFFTVTVNGGTLMDNFVTTTPVLELAPSLWHKTDAVVYETDVEQGLKRMLKDASPWSEERKTRQRQNVCWYRRMSFGTQKAPEENVKVLQQHLDSLKLPQPLEL